MPQASHWVVFLVVVTATHTAAAQPAAAPEPAAPPSSPGAAESAPAGAQAAAGQGAAAPAPAPVAPPEAAAAPSPAQTGPGTGVSSPEALPPSAAQPAPPSLAVPHEGTSAPAPPAERPASMGATTAVDAGGKTDDPTRTRFALELGAGFLGAGRFGGDDAPGRSVQEAVDGMYGLSAMIGSRAALYGLALEIAGLGRDHYATANGGNTVNAAYRVDTLWLQGRWYFSEKRPAVYVTGAAGPALPVAKATGTRPPEDPLVSPPVSYQCTETGKVGLGLAAALGVEFDIARAWSFVSDARFAGHVLSSDSSAFGDCAPATGSALSGTVRVGFQLRL